MAIKAQLFFGIKCDHHFESVLSSSDQAALKFFLSSDANKNLYLQKKTIEGQEYIGKYVEAGATLAQLELLELNIRSLIRRVNPHIFQHQIHLSIVPELTEHLVKGKALSEGCSH